MFAYLDDGTEEKTQHKKQERPMQYIYDNKVTQSYIVFEVEGVRSSMHPNIALDIFLHKITKEDYLLPQSLLNNLKKSDLNLFAQAPHSTVALEKLEESLYVQCEQEIYTDSDGYQYEITARSKGEVILEYSYAQEAITFIVASEDFLCNEDSLYGSMNNRTLNVRGDENDTRV